MIPESAGATPFGIFLLANSFLLSAELCAAAHGNTAPARLLAFHACELYLKTVLRSHGWLIDDLRELNHNLSKMLSAAVAHGMQLSSEAASTLDKASANNHYVKVRYAVTKERSSIKIKTLLDTVSAVRDGVRLALNYDEFGNPMGELWACDPPRDYPVYPARN